MGDTAQPKRLVRRPDEGKLAGVCAGMADYFDTDVTLMRLLWIILSVFPGTIVGGLIAYAVAWLLMPDPGFTPQRSYSGKRLVRSREDRKIAGVCGGLAEFFGLDATLVRLMAVILAIFPGAVICGVLVYGIAWFVIPDGPEPAWQASPSVSGA